MKVRSLDYFELIVGQLKIIKIFSIDKLLLHSLVFGISDNILLPLVPSYPWCLIHEKPRENSRYEIEASAIPHLKI